MTVKLVSVTPDAEKHIAYVARVSNPNNQENEKFSGLLKFKKNIPIPIAPYKTII